MTFTVRAPLPGVVYPDAREVEDYVAAGALRLQSLPEAFAASFTRNADRPALLGLDGVTTYGELDEITDRIAAGFLSLGLRPLDRVVFQLGNCKELIYGFFACLKAGLIPLCTLAAHREQEIGYLARHVGARMHFVQGDDPKFDDVAFAERMQREVPSLGVIVQAHGRPRGSGVALADLAERFSRADARAMLDGIERDPLQAAIFQLSGGTTGIPKVIPQLQAGALAKMTAVADWYRFDENEVLFNPQPLIHNLQVCCCFGPVLLRGGAVIVAANVMPETLVELLRRYPPRWSFISSVILPRLEGALNDRVISFRQSRGVIAPNGSRKMSRILGATVYHQYGMTEGALTGTRPGDPEDAVAETVGRPFSPHNRIRVLRPGTEEEAAPGERGESVITGPFTLKGYYDAPERNKEAFTSDGWYRSGDLVSTRTIEGASFFVFEGRIKDVVDRGGEKISSEEVEWACAAHPAVSAAAVVAMPDPVYGERACAFLIARPGATLPTVAEMGRFLEQHGLAKFKWPERIEAIAEFPVTKSGKLSKADLRQRIAEVVRAERRGAQG